MFPVLAPLAYIGVGIIAFKLHQRGKLRRYFKELLITYPEDIHTFFRKSVIRRIDRDVQRGFITRQEGDKVCGWVQNHLASQVITQVGSLQDQDEPEAGFEDAEVEGGARPVVRRGRRWNAAHEIYCRCVAELGRKPYTPAMSDTVSAVARRVMKTMNVRHVDIPRILPMVLVAYFTPTEEDLMMTAVLNSSEHKRLRELVKVDA